MTTRYSTQITDDPDGSTDAEPVIFALDGKNYVGDLSEKNRTALYKALQPFIDVARSASSSKFAPGSKSTKPSTSGDLAVIREWTGKNGYSVSARGRISSEATRAYEAAQ